MDRINWPFAVTFGFLICLTMAVWALAIREIIDIATERPADCFALTSHECSALMEAR
ncbi:hypothetical protein [Paracoccus versutus]